MRKVNTINENKGRHGTPNGFRSDRRGLTDGCFI